MYKQTKKINLTPRRSLVGSLAIALAGLIIKKIDLYKALNLNIPTPYIWALNILISLVIIAMGYVLIGFLLEIPPGSWLRKLFTKVRNWFHLICLSSRVGIQYIFVPSERGLIHYEELIRAALQKSKKLDVLLVSGFTMYHEQEGFVLEGINRALKHGCQVRILLWDFESPDFISRAEWFILILKIREQEQFKDYTVERYQKDCMQIANDLAAMPGVECRLYASKPEWRIHLTDDYVFFSSYLERTEGNKTTVFGVKRTKELNLYESFRFHFDNLWLKARIVGPDLRKFKRFDIALDAEYRKIRTTSVQNYTPCKCINISEKGILLPVAIPKNTALDLKIKLSESKEIPITGRVVWASRNSRCGVEFDREIKVS